MHNKLQLVILLGLHAITILIYGALSSANTNATSTSATAAVKVAASCTMSTTGGGNYSATVPNGTSAEIAGSTMSVSCNDAGGFALYAVGYSNDTIGNNNMIGQSTNIATNTSGTDSFWAMKINPTSGTTPTIENSFSNYHIVPNAHTKVASYASSTGTGSLSVNATYKANISSTQLAGNYLGKVKYTLIHPAAGPAPVAPLAASDCPARSICYAPNADDVEGTMLSDDFQPIAATTRAGRQTKTYSVSGMYYNISTNSTVLLAAYNYSRPGYGFAGWSPKYDAKVNTSDIIYGPQATISTNPNEPGGVNVSINGLILYPVWVASAGSMQSFTSSDCNAMSIGEVTARTDIRDNNVYAVAKLVDGKCWMVENLRLSNDANITPSNTHSNNGAFGGVFTGLAKSEDANFNDTTPPLPNSLYSIDGTTTNVISGGSSYSYSSRMPRYNNDNNNRSLTASYNGSDSSIYYQWYGYGNFYTWAAAIADTTQYDVNNQSVETTSLCPMGWRLPRGSDKTNEANNEYWNLIVNGLNNGEKPANYDSDSTPSYEDVAEAGPISNAIRSYPNNFVYSGEIQNSNVVDRGRLGRYLTSTVSYGFSAYNMSIYDGPRPTYKSVYPSMGWSKNIGQSIRCLVGY